jgi:hypothetical protein
VPPIVVIEGHDFMFYESVDALIADIERWYPSSVEYCAFDSEGRRVELWADPPITRRRLFGMIWTDIERHGMGSEAASTSTQKRNSQPRAQTLRQRIGGNGTERQPPGAVGRDKRGEVGES